MGRLIDIDVLFDYFGNDAINEITRSNIEYFVREKGTVEAIPKDQYESRLKADLEAILKDLQLEIEEKEQYYQDKFLESKNAVHDAAMGGRMFGCGECKEVIQQKINALEGE